MVDINYANGECFVDHENQKVIYDDDKTGEFTELIDLEDKEEISAQYIHTGYSERWETIQTCFTKHGCEQYLHANAHNLKSYSDLRIYVDTLYRNQEMITIRNYLLIRQ